MSVNSIIVLTANVPDPNSAEHKNRDAQPIDEDHSFRYFLERNIQTLSSKDAGDGPTGLLYVPALQSDDCKEAEEDHVPQNATRLQQLPPPAHNLHHIAIAPWFSPNCMKEYFESVRNDPAIRAVLVYQPGDSAQRPPPMSDASWLLGDGGSWKSANTFPTYAIMPVAGSMIMGQLSLYSGNISTAPRSDLLSADSQIRLSDYIRLWVMINLDGGTRLPSLWVFLIIILGLLLFVIFSTSFFMHFIQRRRREDLRQRVVNGEVNLEAVGVRRLTVPQQFLDKMPLYTYTGPSMDHSEKDTLQVPPSAHPDDSPRHDSESNVRRAPLFRRSSAPSVTVQPNNPTPAFSQPTCPICLDDFEPQETQVRELPCRHIYHPDCIDTFLLNNSSLCPMCKESVLPGGYCPVNITNMMVRRERILRRMQLRSTIQRTAQPPSHSPHVPVPGLGSLGSRIGGAIAGRRVFSAPAHSRLVSADIEMAAQDRSASDANNAASGPPQEAAVSATAPAAATPDCVEPPATDRNEWARRRALAMLGNSNIPAGSEAEEDSGPRWKRVLRKVFPGFR